MEIGSSLKDLNGPWCVSFWYHRQDIDIFEFLAEFWLATWHMKKRWYVCLHFLQHTQKIFWCLFSKNESNSSFSNQTKGERRWKDYVWNTNEMTSSWGIWRWWYFNATWRDGDEIRHLNGRKIDKTSHSL